LKYAIISDLHANLEATLKCFQEIEKLNADKIICLGDLVDYCANPNEVIEIVKEKCNVTILGNHDEAQINFEVSDWFNDYAKKSSIHTRKVIGKDNLEYLKTLPILHSENDLLFVHSSPLNPFEYNYILSEISAMYNFNSFTEKICFIGHSHYPLIFELSNNFAVLVDNKYYNDINLDKNKRYIINVGSVGQPRDGNFKLSFGFFDTETYNYKNIRAVYDVNLTSKKILKEKLPKLLAERILQGL
jgi:predicted phosphodiesterase